MEGNYERILEKIASSAGVDKEEIERKIEAKRAKLSGLISKEGAAQVVASELGVRFDDEQLKIDELLPSMRKVNTSGKVIFVSPVRSFKTKKGIESKVVNLTVADETSNIKAVLWDTNHVDLVEKGEIKEGTSVEMSNGSMRGQEIHLGSFSELKVSDKVFENVKTEKIVKAKSVADLNIGESSSVRAFVVQAFEPKFFSICPECNKKVVQEGEGFLCGEHGKVAPEKRAVINIVVDDGTESIRAVLFHEKISELGINLESENLTNEKEKIMGKEMIFEGNVRNNAFFNTPELIIESVKPVDLDQVINVLEKNAN